MARLATPLLNFGLLTVALASHVGAQQKPATEAPSAVEFRQEFERTIQQCIRDKIQTPKLCRMTAYAAALAAGFPPAEAALLTGYEPPRDKQQ